jgi:hypothetical protein
MKDMLKPRGFFNQSDNSVLVKDYKNRNEKTFVTQNKINIICVLLLAKLSQY